MKITNKEYEVFYTLFNEVCDYRADRINNNLIQLNRIQITSTETVRHRFLIYLLVHNALKNFLTKRLKWINKKNKSIKLLTSDSLNRNISSTHITFFWDDPEWKKFFRSFSNLFKDQFIDLYVEKEPTW